MPLFSPFLWKQLCVLALLVQQVGISADIISWFGLKILWKDYWCKKHCVALIFYNRSLNNIDSYSVTVDVLSIFLELGIIYSNDCMSFQFSWIYMLTSAKFVLLREMPQTLVHVKRGAVRISRNLSACAYPNAFVSIHFWAFADVSRVLKIVWFQVDFCTAKYSYLCWYLQHGEFQ